MYNVCKEEQDRYNLQCGLSYIQTTTPTTNNHIMLCSSLLQLLCKIVALLSTSEAVLDIVDILCQALSVKMELKECLLSGSQSCQETKDK